jgi:glyoxylase-like metal-dependent hydrolase (beta-lactamase superfamily II)
MTLGAGLDCIDLNFLGTPEVIATVVLHGRQGVALIDPGPSTTLPALRDALEARGLAMPDVRAILLTHIHLDHAGSAGTLAAGCRHATVFVHERGAPHLIDPSKLLASATRLYGADMERLWGEVRPVPADRLHVLKDGDVGPFGFQRANQLDIVGHMLEWAWTPGHAWHHVSYFSPASGIAFVGDAAGICRPRGRVVLPPTPPPDIDLEAWRETTDRILAWHPSQIFLTHFGPQPAPRVHFNDLWTRMDDWSVRVKALLKQPGTDDERATAFTNHVMDELTRATSRSEATAYAQAGRFDFSWAGLARYWRKKEGSAPSYRSVTTNQ